MSCFLFTSWHFPGSASTNINELREMKTSLVCFSQTSRGSHNPALICTADQSLALSTFLMLCRGERLSKCDTSSLSHVLKDGCLGQIPNKQEKGQTSLETILHRGEAVYGQIMVSSGYFEHLIDSQIVAKKCGTIIRRCHQVRMQGTPDI